MCIKPDLELSACMFLSVFLLAGGDDEVVDNPWIYCVLFLYVQFEAGVMVVILILLGLLFLL